MSNDVLIDIFIQTLQKRMEKRRASVDMTVAERMKSENSEKFISLVRMHLSFELELNTDE